MVGGFNAFIGIKVDTGVNAETEVSVWWNLMETGCLGFLIRQDVIKIAFS